MTRAEIERAAAMIRENGLTGDAQIWFPDLARYNELRAELGAEPHTRDEVPDNIHFADEELT